MEHQSSEKLSFFFRLQAIALSPDATLKHYTEVRNKRTSSPIRPVASDVVAKGCLAWIRIGDPLHSPCAVANGFVLQLDTRKSVQIHNSFLFKLRRFDQFSVVFIFSTNALILVILLYLKIMFMVFNFGWLDTFFLKEYADIHWCSGVLIYRKCAALWLLELQSSPQNMIARVEIRILFNRIHFIWYI